MEKTRISQHEYRKKLKAVGFKVRFKTVSFMDLGRKLAAVPYIYDMEGNRMPTGVIHESDYPKWKPALDIYNEFRV